MTARTFYQRFKAGEFTAEYDHGYDDAEAAATADREPDDPTCNPTQPVR